MRRSALCAGGWFAAGLPGCQCSAPDLGGASTGTVPAPQVEGPWVMLHLSHGRDPVEKQRAFVRLDADSPKPLVVVALHGRGEAGRGLEVGARAWNDDYHLERMIQKLAAPPIRPDDVSSWIDQTRLDAVARALAAEPYRAPMFACPHTPVPSDSGAGSLESFAGFVTEKLLPEVGALRATTLSAQDTGIDGVSMGGRWALEIGLRFPRVFGSVGALQPAIRESDAERLAGLAANAMAVRKQAIRLASSEGDPFLGPTQALARALDRSRVPHRLVITRGPHDYAYNRGPGALELALFHERALRGLEIP